MNEKCGYLIIHAHTEFSVLGHLIDRNTTKYVHALQTLNRIEHQVRHFEALLRNASDDHCKVGLYTLTYNLLDHIMEDLGCFVCLELLRSTTYELFIVQLKRACHITAQHCTSALEVLLSAVEMHT